MKSPKLYHGTTRERLLKILKSGLKIKSEKGSTVTDDAMSKSIKAVSLTKSLKDAICWANRKRLMTNYFETPIVLEINYPQTNLELAIEQNNKKQKHLISRKTIPINNIVGFRVVKKLDDEQVLKELGLEK